MKNDRSEIPIELKLHGLKLALAGGGGLLAVAAAKYRIRHGRLHGLAGRFLRVALLLQALDGNGLINTFDLHLVARAA